MMIRHASSPRRRREEGSILIVALTTVLVVVSALTIAFLTTSATARISDRSLDLAAVQAGTEGTLEYGFAIWKARLSQQYRAISTTEASANLTPPTFPNLSYVTDLQISAADSYGTPSTVGTPVGDPIPMSVDVPGYPGWRGRSFNYVATATLKANNVLGADTYPIKYGIKRYFTYTEMSLFQTMFFFEHDIELYRSNTMIVGGLTHTNHWAFISDDATASTTVTFKSPVSYVGGFTNSTIPYRANTWSGYADPTANPNTHSPVTFAAGATLTQVDRLEPFGQDPAELINPVPAASSAYAPAPPDNSEAKGQYVGVTSDTDSNPNNDSMHELIEPPVTTGTPAPLDPPAIAKRRIYGKAGIIINVNGATKTITTANGVSLNSTQITTIQNAISTTASLYDQREQANIHVTNIDLSAIRTTLDAATNFNGVVYVTDSTPTTTSVPKNAVRLQNGGQLPANGLTVASQNGIYIQGDYNTGTTTNPTSVPSNSGGNANNTDSPTVSGYTRKPAAILADAVMVLSNSWQDTNAGKDLSTRVASNTTVNAAFLAGFMPSGFTPSTGSQYGYSGGANNYPRLLEDWSGKYFTYFGSMVELFQSNTFTGRWDTGNIYSAPTRCWNYDPNFDTTSPPGSIDAVATSRGSWARYTP